MIFRLRVMRRRFFHRWSRLGGRLQSSGRERVSSAAWRCRISCMARGRGFAVGCRDRRRSKSFIVCCRSPPSYSPRSPRSSDTSPQSGIAAHRVPQFPILVCGRSSQMLVVWLTGDSSHAPLRICLACMADVDEAVADFHKVLTAQRHCTCLM